MLYKIKILLTGNNINYAIAYCRTRQFQSKWKIPEILKPYWYLSFRKIADKLGWDLSFVDLVNVLLNMNKALPMKNITRSVNICVRLTTAYRICKLFSYSNLLMWKAATVCWIEDYKFLETVCPFDMDEKKVYVMIEFLFIVCTSTIAAFFRFMYIINLNLYFQRKSSRLSCF